jgi:hypothetical protein
VGIGIMRRIVANLQFFFNSQKVFSGLAHLPIAVKKSFFERCRYFWSVEGGEGQNGTPPYCWFIGATLQDDRHSSLIANGS